ncbi:hypothetical protein EVAR_28497_1 [Eumeta japonica]|uniref:Uncharacterized protein n=1 Tax=Eumeta variegata TaxID=151549 RepID=A0A4C1WSP6_EUMVA|nr:hypothetical protein EVAR_28497_1 [Eumeta japonica]
MGIRVGLTEEELRIFAAYILSEMFYASRTSTTESRGNEVLGPDTLSHFPIDPHHRAVHSTQSKGGLAHARSYLRYGRPASAHPIHCQNRSTALVAETNKAAESRAIFQKSLETLHLGSQVATATDKETAANLIVVTIKEGNGGHEKAFNGIFRTRHIPDRVWYDGLLYKLMNTPLLPAQIRILVTSASTSLSKNCFQPPPDTRRSPTGQQPVTMPIHNLHGRHPYAVIPS